MGQGASTPRDETRNINSDNYEALRRRRDHEQQQGGSGTAGGTGGGTGEGGNGGDLSPDRAAAAARLRRSRRLRNHMEHFARLGNRLIPASSSTSSSNSSTLRNRVPGLRFRSRSVRYGGSRSRSPSPNRGSARNDSTTQQRRRTLPPISRPIPMPLPSFVDSAIDPIPDMMDISPVSTVTPQPRTAGPRPLSTASTAAPGGSRRSRLSRVRDSISSWPNISELGSIIASSRRPSETPLPNLDTLPHRNRSTTNMDLTGEGDADPAGRPSSPNRADRPPLFGPGASLLDGIQNNPSRVRPGEDQAAMLSRLLSVAAAATAASLVGNAEEAITQAQDVGGDNGGDGSFESFLRALQNGRLEAALRNGGNEMGGGATPPDPNAEGGVLSLNFFRMFRFGSTPASSEGGENGENSEEGGGRMVPVIIVGIRSVTPRDSTDGGDGNNRPAPFFDALANLPVSLPRRSRLGSGSGAAHRRAVSLGSSSRPVPSNASTPPDYVPDVNPFTAPHTHTDTPSGPSPPPTTPADPVLPTFPSGSFPSHRRSAVEPGTADSFGDGEGSNARDPFRRSRLPRRLSNPDNASPFGLSPGSSSETGNRDRNSTGPGLGRPNLPEGTRSWIIYVLGGSYPENHPILTTPSLFTDEPTYEDMTLLSSLLGPAKLPVAAKEDLESAGGIFTFSEGSAEQYGAGNAERCLICLSDYETGHECRQLVKCNHIFHKECIDEWLTTGRNSCPLCRGEGVEEKAKAAEQAPPIPRPENVEQTAAAS
ncbi:hypothetical protein K440DRAFT_613746 [Wilcoxina mikolae CBS 423.85]|nr:hypothetical protein K440DRAFT_613746 [Wilcoxina mikolae CBS 423.85]